MTAKNQSEDVVDALKFGANDYVTKPVDFSIALARVNTQISRRRAELELLDTNQTLLNAKATLEHRVSERAAKLVQANAAIQEEISRRIASEDKIAYLARHDTLTGLANRFTFEEELNAARQFARECGSQLSLLFIDLDGFKNVNDTLGHGDRRRTPEGRRPAADERHRGERFLRPPRRRRVRDRPCLGRRTHDRGFARRENHRRHQRRAHR